MPWTATEVRLPSSATFVPPAPRPSYDPARNLDAVRVELTEINVECDDAPWLSTRRTKADLYAANFDLLTVTLEMSFPEFATQCEGEDGEVQTERFPSVDRSRGGGIVRLRGVIPPGPELRVSTRRVHAVEPA